MVGQFIQQAAGLRHAYWQIRYIRNVNRRRNWYRKAAKEKGQLVALGWDREVVRLYALHLKDPAREDRLKRFYQAFEEALLGPKQLSVHLHKDVENQCVDF